VYTWVDYSKKYGIGYMLNDGSVGVYFNDGSKILGGYERPFVYYVDKKEKEGQKYIKEEFPQEHSRKLTLLVHFKKYLSEKQTKRTALGRGNASYPLGTVYLRKWLSTSHGVIMRLSNGVVQVYFKDNTELFYEQTTTLVSYINKKFEVETVLRK